MKTRTIRTDMNEEEYFRKQNAELKSRLKAREHFKEKGVQDESLIDQLNAIGLNQDSMRAVFMIPLIDTAWADGDLHFKERDEVLAILKEQGIQSHSEAYQLVSNWLRQPPTNAIYSQAKHLLQPLISEIHHNRNENLDWVLESSRRIAEATGCLLNRIGIKGSVSEEEHQVIARISHLIESAKSKPPSTLRN